MLIARGVLLICFTLTVSGLWAQDRQEFGSVNLNEFNEAYRSDAPAAVLFDHGKTRFLNRNGIYIEFTHETRIQIHQKSGYEYAEVEIPYYQDGYGKTELIEKIEAYSYTINNDNGLIEKIPVVAREIYTEEVNEYWKVKRFAFPNVREGSIIEYKYVKRTPFLTNPPDWEFQKSIPVKFSQYEIHMIPFYEYSFLLQGSSKFDDYKTWQSSGTDSFGGITYNFMIHQYTMKDVQPFTDESFITSRNDYITKLDFQLARVNHPTGATDDFMSTWNDICDEYLDMEKFGKYLKQSEKYAKALIEANPDIASSQNQIKAIVRYVREKFEWDGIARDFAIIKAKEFTQQGNGASAEVNLFLCAMLREAGFDANPVLISTRNHGKVKTKYPFSHYFNDVIVAVKQNGKFQLLDGTTSSLAYNQLPLRCLNEVGLLVLPSTEQWISLESNSRSVENYYLDMAIDPAVLAVDARMAIRLDGYEGYAARRSVAADGDKLMQSRLSLGYDELSDISFSNVADPEKVYSVKFSGARSIDGYDDKLLVQPFAGLIDEESPFKASTRQYPVDMLYPRTKQITIKLKIPEGYGVQELPTDFTVNNQLLKSSISIQNNGDFLQISGNLTFTSAVYQARDYPKLREDYAYILDQFNQAIVFNKIQ